MGLFDHLFKPKPEGPGEKVVEFPAKAAEAEKRPAGKAGESAPSPVEVPFFLQPKDYVPRGANPVIPGLRPGSNVVRSPEKKTSPPPERRASPEEPTSTEILLTLGDVIGRIPPHFLRPGPHDTKRELQFQIDDLSSDIARGRAAVPLSRIAALCPEIFHSKIESADDVEVRLPLQKLVEQIGALRARPRPTPTVGIFRAPTLARNIVTGTPPPAAPAETAHPAPNPDIASRVAGATSPPAPAERPAAEARQEEPSAPAVAGAKLPAFETPPPPAAGERKAIEHPHPEESADAAELSGEKIHLSLAAVLAHLPRGLQTGKLPALDESARLTLPFALIERQLGSGKVEIDAGRLAALLPAPLQAYFRLLPGLKVGLPLEEIFQNLPLPHLPKTEHTATDLAVEKVEAAPPPEPPAVPAAFIEQPADPTPPLATFLAGKSEFLTADGVDSAVEPVNSGLEPPPAHPLEPEPVTAAAEPLLPPLVEVATESPFREPERALAETEKPAVANLPSEVTASQDAPSLPPVPAPPVVETHVVSEPVPVLETEIKSVPPPDEVPPLVLDATPPASLLEPLVIEAAPEPEVVPLDSVRLGVEPTFSVAEDSGVAADSQIIPDLASPEPPETAPVVARPFLRLFTPPPPVLTAVPAFDQNAAESTEHPFVLQGPEVSAMEPLSRAETPAETAEIENPQESETPTAVADPGGDRPETADDATALGAQWDAHPFPDEPPSRANAEAPNLDDDSQIAGSSFFADDQRPAAAVESSLTETEAPPAQVEISLLPPPIEPNPVPTEEPADRLVDSPAPEEIPAENEPHFDPPTPTAESIPAPSSEGWIPQDEPSISLPGEDLQRFVAFAPPMPPPLIPREPMAAGESAPAPVLQASQPASESAPVSDLPTTQVQPSPIFRPFVLPPLQLFSQETAAQPPAPFEALPPETEREIEVPELAAPAPEPPSFTPETTPPTLEPSAPQPEPTASQPEPTAFQPEPTASQPEPTASQPEPTASQPEPTTSQPEPTAPFPEPVIFALEPAPVEEPAPPPPEESDFALAETPTAQVVGEPGLLLSIPRVGSTSTPDHHESVRPPLPFTRFDQDALQALFMTEETLDLAGISRHSAALPGMQACLIATRDETASSGVLPEGFDLLELRSLSPHVGVAAGRLPIGVLKHFTLYGDQYSVSFFERRELSLCAVHRGKSFVPGVREKLVAVADELARA